MRITHDDRRKHLLLQWIREDRRRWHGRGVQGLSKRVPVKELAGVVESSRDWQHRTDGLGAALGTAYMSPGQALGRPVDVRTDLFSFSIVLYEMCTGRSPFAGDTTGELLIAIVQQVQVTPAQKHE